MQANERHPTIYRIALKAIRYIQVVPAPGIPIGSLWLNLQSAYDLKVEEQRLPEIRRQIRSLAPAR